MEDEKEVLDLVNTEDEVVGTISRGEVVKSRYRVAKGFVRCVNAFLINKEGKIWVPTRSLDKDLTPGSLDYSVARHVLSGETYDNAIIRAFAMEAGIQITGQELKLLCIMKPNLHRPVFDAIYVYYNYKDGTPEYSRGEFTSGEWLTPSDYQDRLKTSALPVNQTILPALTVLLEDIKQRQSSGDQYN
jgi:isopentenyldiphosphate isomerase